MDDHGCAGHRCNGEHTSQKSTQSVVCGDMHLSDAQRNAHPN